jgi:hypothetical protein
MPITRESNERDFVTKILKYKKVISAGNSVTIIEDLMELTSCLINKRCTGIFNAVNPGIMSHNQILSLYKEIVDPGLEWENFSIEDMHKETLAKRSNCFLDTTKLLEYYSMPDVNVSLKKCFEYRRDNE